MTRMQRLHSRHITQTHAKLFQRYTQLVAGVTAKRQSLRQPRQVLHYGPLLVLKSPHSLKRMQTVLKQGRMTWLKWRTLKRRSRFLQDSRMVSCPEQQGSYVKLLPPRVTVAGPCLSSTRQRVSELCLAP